MGVISTTLKSHNYDVVGESNYQDVLSSIAGGFSRESQYIDCDAVIEKEPSNPYDSNAVKVTINKLVVGYIPARDAVRVGNALTKAEVNKARVEAQIRGGWKTNQHDHGQFGVKLKLPKSGISFVKR